MTYTVYGIPGSRTTRVTWLLEELGAEYKFIKAMPHSKRALGVNPSGKVPVLKDGKAKIIDSTAILHYLADKHSDSGFSFAPGSIDRAMLDSWVQFAICDIEAPLWLYTRHAYLLPEQQRIEAILPSCVEDWQQAIAILAQRLGDNDYAMANGFSIVDIILGQVARWAERLKFPVDNDLVADYFQRMQYRPALAEAIKRERDLR